MRELYLNKAITKKNLNQYKNIHDEQYSKILNKDKTSITDFSFCLRLSAAWHSTIIYPIYLTIYFFVHHSILAFI